MDIKLRPTVPFPVLALQANQNLSKVVAVLVRVLGGGTRLVTGEVGKRAAVLLQQLQASGMTADTLQVRGTAGGGSWRWGLLLDHP